MVMNQTNKGVIITCCCEYTCDRNDELHLKLGGKWTTISVQRKKRETMKETLYGEHP